MNLRDVYNVLRKMKRRYYIIKYGLKNVSPTFIACRGCHISKDFVAGDYSFVGSNCLIYPKVKIGKYTMIANNVNIIGGDHYYKNVYLPIIFAGREKLKETIIGDDVWVGAHSIIMTGVCIGNGSIIAAGSVVTKDVPPYSIVGGTPAKFVKMRFTEKDILLHERILKEDDFPKSNFRNTII